MQPSNWMLRRLREWAGVPAERGASEALRGSDPGAMVVASNAYTLGKIDGKAEMAREILEDLARGE
jgi:hypothetical protein